MKTKWTEDGVLVIDAQLPKQMQGGDKPKVKEIPIEHGQKQIEEKNANKPQMEEKNVKSN